MASAIMERAEFPVHRNKTLKCPCIGISLVAAGWPAARVVSLWLYGPYESTHELAIHLRCDCINIDVLARKKFAGVLDAVDSSGFEVNLLKSGRCKLAAIFVLF